MRFVSKLIDLKIIDKENKDIYEYGFNSLIHYIFFAFLLILSNLLVTHELINTIIFLLLFFNIRRYCGGIHFNNQYVCFIGSLLFSLVIPYFCSHFKFYNDYILIIEICFSIMLCFLPIVDHPNKPVDDRLKRIYHRYIIVFLVIYMMFSVLSLYFKNIVLFYLILTAILSNAVFVLLGYLKYKIIHRI